MRAAWGPTARDAAGRYSPGRGHRRQRSPIGSGGLPDKAVGSKESRRAGPPIASQSNPSVLLFPGPAREIALFMIGPNPSGLDIVFNKVCVLVTAAFALTLVPGFPRSEQSLRNKGTKLLVFLLLGLVA